MKGNAKVVIFSILAVFAITAALAFAQAAAPAQEQLPIQGFLKDSAGKPVTQDLSITFKLYDVATGGTALVTETQTISVKKGVWSTMLGKSAVFPASMNFNVPYYVELSIGGNTLNPRVIITPGAFIARKNFAVADGSIITAKLAAGAVTGDKIANDAISGNKIANGAISSYTVDKIIADGSITRAKIANGAIDGTKLAAGTVVANIGDGSIPFSKLSILSSGGISAGFKSCSSNTVIPNGNMDLGSSVIVCSPRDAGYYVRCNPGPTGVDTTCIDFSGNTVGDSEKGFFYIIMPKKGA